MTSRKLAAPADLCCAGPFAFSCGDMRLLPRIFPLALSFVPLGCAIGKLPHAFLEFLLPRIILVPQHGQPPGVAGEIAFVERLPPGKGRTGNVPGNSKEFNAFVGGNRGALIIAFHVSGTVPDQLFMAWTITRPLAPRIWMISTNRG